jgi:hypothetical protein
LGRGQLIAGGIEALLSLVNGQLGGGGIQRRQQLPVPDVLADMDVDAGEGAAGAEVRLHVNPWGQIAGGAHRGLNHATLRGHDLLRGAGADGRRAHVKDGGHQQRETGGGHGEQVPAAAGAGAQHALAGMRQARPLPRLLTNYRLATPVIIG